MASDSAGSAERATVDGAPTGSDRAGPETRPEPRVVDLRLSRLLGILLTIIAGATVLWITALALAPISHLLLLLLLALILAFILSPLVDLQVRRGAPRPVAILVSFLALLALTVISLTWLYAAVIALRAEEPEPELAPVPPALGHAEA